MARPKNRPKKEVLSAASWDRKVFLAVYGEGISSRAFFFITDGPCCFLPGETYAEEWQGIRDTVSNEVLLPVVETVAQAIRTRDSAFFREIADIIERMDSPPDSRLMHVALGLCKEEDGDAPATYASLRRRLKINGYPCSQKQLKRYVVEYLGTTAARGRPGQPKKTPSK
jgi:hypothetical protein